MVNPAIAEPRASLRNAIDSKCHDCGATDAGAHWRLHVAACPVTTCPLWTVRPLPKPAPKWLASRDPRDLPTDWGPKPTEAAIASIKAIGAPVMGLPGELKAPHEPDDQCRAGRTGNPDNDGASDG